MNSVRLAPRPRGRSMIRLRRLASRQALAMVERALGIARWPWSCRLSLWVDRLVVLAESR
jgi:hypothetical protein